MPNANRQITNSLKEKARKMMPQTQRMSTTNKNTSSKPAFNFNFGGLEEKDSEDSTLRRKKSSKGASDLGDLDLDDDI